jgi:4,5-DOPA dioxygenase extradiol
MSEQNNTRMPVLFIGHGSPMNALAKNDYTETLNKLASTIAKPKAILMVSAHWLTEGTFITSTDTPKMIYDFYGFPDELYQVKYPAVGSQAAALKIHTLMDHTTVKFDNGEWGLDHGTWSVLKHLYPNADIPVLQLSIDMTKPAEYHLKLGHELQRLRDEGILIIGSGNVVHNLRNFSWKETETPFDWAIEFDTWIKEQIENKNYLALAKDYNKTIAGQKSVPSLDHYLPLLYIVGASDEKDKLSFIYEKIQNGSIAMRSFQLG